MNSSGLIDVFPISDSVFGLKAGWLASVAPKFVHLAYVLMTLMLVVSIGIMVLKQFEEVQPEKKLWNICFTIVAIFAWPGLVLELKGLIDAFDTFLVRDIFKISWVGFGFPHAQSVLGVAAWPAESLGLLFPNLAFWIVYGFYIVFIFFHVVLGPLILAKGVLFNEIDAFLELLKEIILLFMWQTMIVVLVGFIDPDIVSGSPTFDHSDNNAFFLSVILGIMIFFVPSMTRKFGNHLGSSFFPNFLRMGGLVLGVSAAGKLGAAGFSAVGVPVEKFTESFDRWHHRFMFAENAHKRFERLRQVNELEKDQRSLEGELEHRKLGEHWHMETSHPGRSPDEMFHTSHGSVLDLSKRAKTEVQDMAGEGGHAV